MKWNLDTTHSHVDFSVKHLMISTVRGRFTKFEGSGETNGDGTLKSVSLTMDTASIDTNTPQRDDHLRSADFFDAAANPKIAFTSTKVVQSGTDITIDGDLAMHGVTHPVTLKGEITGPITDPWGNPRRALTVSGKLSRKDWGLTYNQAIEAGGVVISDEVKLTVEVAAVGEKAAA
jgi:polyisoprenoid-binding protein YceI